jgi:hypothetical protein
MHLRTRAAPLVLLVGVVLVGCNQGDGKKGAPEKKFEGPMPSAGAADVTIHVAMS